MIVGIHQTRRFKLVCTKFNLQQFCFTAPAHDLWRGQTQQRELAYRLKHAPSSKELEWLINKNIDIVNQQHVVTAFRTLIRCRGQIRKSFVDSLLEIIQKNYQDYDQRAIATIIWGLGKLGIRLEQSRQEMIIKSIQQNLRFFDERDVVDVAYGLASLRIYDREIMTVIAEILAQKYSQLSKQQLSEEEIVKITQEMCIMVWSFARMKIKHQNLFKQVASQVIQNKEILNAQNIASIAWSYSRLQFDSKNQIYSVLMQRADELMDYLTPFNFNKIVWAFCHAQYTPDVFQEFVAKYIKLQIDQFKSLDLLDFVRVWVFFDQQDGQFGNSLLKRTKQIAGQLSKNDLAIMCRNLIKLGTYDQELIDLVTNLLRESLNEIDIENLVNLLQVFSKSGLKLNDKFVDDMSFIIVQNIEELPLSSLALSIWSLARLEKASDEIVEFVDMVLLKNKNEKINLPPFAIASFTLAYAQIGKIDPQILEFLSQQAYEQCFEFNSIDATSFIAAITKLEHKDKKLLDKFAEYVIRNVQQFNAREISQLAFDFAVLKYKNDDLYNACFVRFNSMFRSTAYQAALVMWAISQNKPLSYYNTRKIRRRASETLETLDLEKGAILINSLVSNQINDKQLINSVSSRIKDIFVNYEQDQHLKLQQDFQSKQNQEIISDYHQHDFQKHTYQQQLQSSLNQQNIDSGMFLNLVSGFASVRQYDEQLFDHFCELAQNLNFKQQLQVLHNCAIVNHKNLDLVQTIMNNSKSEIKTLEEQETLDAIWSMAVLDVDFRELWWNLAFDHLQKFDTRNLSEDNLNLLNFVLLYFKSQGEKNADKLFDFEQDKSEESRQKSSSKYQNVVEQFIQEKYNLITINLSHSKFSLIDFEFEYEGCRILAQADGPFRYTLNAPYRIMGQTNLRDRILRGQGIQTLKIPFFEWNKAVSDNAKIKYLDKELQQFIQQQK